MKITLKRRVVVMIAIIAGMLLNIWLVPKESGEIWPTLRGWVYALIVTVTLYCIWPWLRSFWRHKNEKQTHPQ
jgi:hypothetical protein